MDSEIREVVNLVVSVLATSVVIIAAVIFSNLSYKAFNHKLKTDAINNDIKMRSEVYNLFINNNSNVSGVDIIDFITVHDKNYRYRIVTRDGDYRLSSDGLVDLNTGVYAGSSDNLWTQSYLTKLLEGSLNDKYSGTIVSNNGEELDVTDLSDQVWIKFKAID